MMGVKCITSGNLKKKTLQLDEPKRKRNLRSI
jgi:hypothetical protein